MAPPTTAIRSLPRIVPLHMTVHLKWLHVAAAYLLPTLATGAGGYLALAMMARLLGALTMSQVVH